MNPLVGFALAHAEQTPLDHLERIGGQVDQQEEESLFRGRSGAVFVHAKPARGPRLPSEAPRGHRRLERCFKRWDELLALVKRHAGQIQALRGAGRHIREP